VPAGRVDGLAGRPRPAGARGLGPGCPQRRALRPGRARPRTWSRRLARVAGRGRGVDQGAVPGRGHARLRPFARLGFTVPYTRTHHMA